MALSDQYQDSFSDDSQDDSYSDYSTKAKTTRKRASSTNKKTNKMKAASTPKRPGRKPIEKHMDEELGGDPKLKRKAQNRAAQRAFRERKEKHVSELEDRIRELEDEKSSKETDLELENAKLKRELEKLREENYSLKDSKFTFEYPRHDNSTNGYLSTASSNDMKTTTTTVSNAQPLDSPPLSSTTPSITDDYNSGNNSDHIEESSTTNNNNNNNNNKNIDILSNNDNNSNRSQDVSGSSSSGSENNSPPTSNNTGYGNNMASFTNTPLSSTNNIDNNYDGLFNISNQGSAVASFGLLNDLGPNYIDTFSPSNNPDTSDLFHGKTDFAFSSYRNPVTSADDWLFHDNTQLPPLFGVDADRYGFNQQTSNTSSPFPVADTGLNGQAPSLYNADNTNNYYNNINTSINPNFSQASINNINSIYNNNNNNNASSIYVNSMNNNNNNTTHNTTTYDYAYPSHQQQQRISYYNDPELTPSKAKVLETIRLAKEQGKTRLEVKAALKTKCPDFNVDILCDELRRKAVCYDSTQPFSDRDLDIVATCVKQH